MSPRGSLLLNPLPRQFLGAYALEDAPALVQRGGGVYDVVDLVSARERPAIQKDETVGISLQELARGFNHEVQAEVILPGRVFDFIGGEKRVPDLVFIQHPAAQATS